MIKVMTSTLRKHLIICLCLGLVVIPIYFLDLASTGSGGGNWITLDFRGLIFWTYITLLAIHVALSSIGAVSLPKAGVVRIHFWSMVLSVILLVTGFVVYARLLRAQANSDGIEAARAIAGVVKKYPNSLQRIDVIAVHVAWNSSFLIC